MEFIFFFSFVHKSIQSKKIATQYRSRLFSNIREIHHGRRACMAAINKTPLYKTSTIDKSHVMLSYQTIAISLAPTEQVLHAYVRSLSRIYRCQKVPPPYERSALSNIVDDEMVSRIKRQRIENIVLFQLFFKCEIIDAIPVKFYAIKRIIN